MKSHKTFMCSDVKYRNIGMLREVRLYSVHVQLFVTGAVKVSIETVVENWI